MGSRPYLLDGTTELFASPGIQLITRDWILKIIYTRIEPERAKFRPARAVACDYS
ncbi:MAG: hypothetical protein OER86_05490 [Phycisphaerae bacterium]|nr:hypothetical protein [Phycisphaerae bacterium]